MATYLEVYNLIGNEDFTKRIKVALIHAAFGILGEPPGTPQHPRRAQWARLALQENLKIPMRIVVIQVVADPTVDGASSDAVLQARIDSILNELIAQEA